MSINNKLDSLPDMAMFACVVEAGSFSAAARQMGLSPSAVSRQVARLEALLRVRLLERSTRRLRPTEAGQAAYSSCQAMLAAAREVIALSDTNSAAQPSGLIRVSCPKAIARQLIHPLVAGFLARYPQVDVQLVVTDRTVDLYREAIDLAICVGDSPPPGLAGRPLLRLRHMLCASPQYLSQRGMPSQPRELAAHSCLYLGEDERDRHWRFKRAGEAVTVKVTGRYVANHSELRLEGAIQHLGIASLPEFVARAALESGELVPVLSDWEHATDYAGMAWLLYPPNRFMAPKLRAWIDHLVGGLAD
ncbi:LysR family transcriptional regulator [Roseateles oligotrophus]|uniref:LysR family transcriptional regulator n=1 Tax=Roseateles oligotrophus TaxID=1769250 RepID=A0ABT2YCN6_9BURK|nr:LysR family transcriptional regulator [Roseateles oligotrophus]MCV2367802.1 LysR family transcriptional regulator [Roseateles oligotrophus]